jgi:TolB protein
MLMRRIRGSWIDRIGWVPYCAALWLVAQQAQAQLTVEITRGVERPVPMAIVPFGWQGPGAAAPYDLAAVVTADLGNSGRFAPIPVANMLTRPTEPSQVNFSDWRILNVDVVVIGQLSETAPDRYTAVFELFDVLRGEQLLGFRLTSNRADLRATAHRISDMIYEELTGIPGVFSTQIAYVTETRDASGTASYALIVSDADGENAQTVTESSQPLMSPAWSPDGRSLAYVSFEDNRSQIFVQTLRTGSRRAVSSREGINGAPVFSPDGRKLALTLSREGNLDIFTLDLTNQVLIQITRDNAIDTEPNWSPDGQSIFFTSDRAGRPQVYRVTADAGQRAQRVTYEGSYNARPRVSPDGQNLAVVYQDRDNFRIAIVDPQTGFLRQVLTQGSLDESPSFAPNGDTIIYATRESGQGVLASVSADGRIQREIASVAGDVREPAWSPYPRP